MPPRLFTIPQLAELAGIDYKTMRRMLEEAGVEYLRTKKTRFVPLSEVAEKLGPLLESVKWAKLLVKLANAEAETGA
jgi:hypothetical protein